MQRNSTTSLEQRPDHHPADLVETGNLLRTENNAFRESAANPATSTSASIESRDVVVIGAGQAGLSVSYQLQKQGVNHIVLDGASRIGDVWRNRWDSLRLFTAAKFDGLEGYRFPANKDAFPTKDEMADYLESYAKKFDLPVRLKTRVKRLYKSKGRFRVDTSDGVFEADQVVVAAASYQKPRVPEFAGDLGDDIVQLHSNEYKNPSQLPAGSVLLVGAGNSGAEIAMDLVKSHEVHLAGRDVGNVPFNIAGFMGRKILVRMVVRGAFHHVLTMRTPMGRNFRKKNHGHGLPLIRTRPGQMENAGVHRIGKIKGIQKNIALAEDGSEVAFASIIWCTGYHPGFDWIDLPALDDSGTPRHQFGKSLDIKGLYFSGLHFQYSVSSTMVAGVGRDARRVAAWVAKAVRG